MTEDNRIKEKRDELLKTFAHLSDDEIKIASGLIDQAAFLAVTLEDLAALIQTEGVTEEYTNGANQKGRKISSNAKAYTAMIGKYTTITTKLLQLVPHGTTRPLTLSEILDLLSEDAKNDLSQGFYKKRAELQRDLGYREYITGECE